MGLRDVEPEPALLGHRLEGIGRWPVLAIALPDVVSGDLAITERAKRVPEGLLFGRQ